MPHTEPELRFGRIAKRRPGYTRMIRDTKPLSAQSLKQTGSRTLLCSNFGASRTSRGCTPGQPVTLRTSHGPQYVMTLSIAFLAQPACSFFSGIQLYWSAPGTQHTHTRTASRAMFIARLDFCNQGRATATRDLKRIRLFHRQVTRETSSPGREMKEGGGKFPPTASQRVLGSPKHFLVKVK